MVLRVRALTDHGADQAVAISYSQAKLSVCLANGSYGPYDLAVWSIFVGCGLWSMVELCSKLIMLYGVWSTALGVWSMAYDLWSMVSGLCAKARTHARTHAHGPHAL